MKRLWFALVAAVVLLVTLVPPATAQESPGGQPQADGSSEEAMRDFLATLTTMAEQVFDSTEPGSPERAEGLRHIVRLIEMQNGRFTDDADPANPFLSRCPGGICKLGMDNPDFTYQAIEPISAEYEYRITGRRGTVPYITMQVFEGALGGEIAMTSEDLVVDDDGTFEIILSATEPDNAQNWLELKDEARSFLIRQGYNDWNTDLEAVFEVEVIGGPDVGPVSHLTDTEFVDDVGGLSTLLSALIPIMQDARAGWPSNDLTEPSVAAFGIEGAGFPTTVGSVGTYEFAEDEAMIIELSDRDVVHGGIQLGNVWLESLDYRTRQTSLNWYQSVPDADGTYRYVLAHTDPGTANWLDVSGHGEGSIFIRWQDPSDADFPERPHVSVVPLDEVADNLPADHPVVTPAERDEALQLRDAGINRRRNPVEPPEATEAAAESADDGSDSVWGWAVALGVAVLAAGVIGWAVGRRTSSASQRARGDSNAQPSDP